MSKPNRPQPPPISAQKTAARPPVQRKQSPPTAPPVYRPQPPPRVLQLKAAHVSQVSRARPTRKLNAPPAYQPNSVPKCLQPKSAVHRPPAGSEKMKSTTKTKGASAPPVYRPQPLPKVLQRKTFQPSHVSSNVAQSNAARMRPGAIQPKATPQPPPAYRPQPVPACLRTSRPAAATAVQRKIIINGKDVDKNGGAKTLLENRMKQYDLEKTNDVYIALRASKSEFKYESEDEVVAEIKVRQHIASGIELIEAHAAYNHGGDALRLGNEWETVAGIAGDEETNAHVFRPTGKASDAINQLFSTNGNLLECNSATVAVHYHALLKTMGADAFNADFEGQVVVMPDKFVKIYEHGIEEDAPTLELIQSVVVKSEDELVKGDWVFFMNYPEYEEINDLLEDKGEQRGPFEGENAIYLGNDRYKGFGLDNVTFNNMVKKLKDEYNELVDEYVEKVFNVDTRRNKVQQYKKKQAREHNAETLDGEVPGIEKISVRRVMASKYVKTQAGAGVFEQRVAELLAKLDSAAPAEKHKLWKTMDHNFRDAVKAKVLDNRVKYSSIFRHIFGKQYHRAREVRFYG